MKYDFASKIMCFISRDRMYIAMIDVSIETRDNKPRKTFGNGMSYATGNVVVVI